MADLLALYQTYKRTLVRITAEDGAGDLSTGTGFHIGDGWIVTARHVVENLKIHEIAAEQGADKIVVKRQIFPANPDIDLALLETDFELSHYMTKTTLMNMPDGFKKVDHIELGGHLDDWLGDELYLSKVLLMGYPPVPLSIGPMLLASEGEVNGIVDKVNAPHPQFIISCMARGGFSGGPVLSEYGFLLGVLTESLVGNVPVAELGFCSAISIEPLLMLLHEHKIYPASNGPLIKELMDH